MSDDESRPNKKARKPDPDDESAGSDDGSDEGEEIIGPNGKKMKGKGGSSCHQCKSRRNFGALTYCTSNLDKKNKRCRKKFCGHCLKKFYKENVDAIVDKNNWACPSCRKICCCAACRRRKNKEGSKAASSDLSPPPAKPKKSSSHKDHHHRDRHSGGAGHGYSRHDASDVLQYGPGGVPTNDEGYPIQSSRRDRGLHGSSHSPRMMSDSPSMRGTSANLPRPYDLDDRDDRKRGSRGGRGSGGKHGGGAAHSSEYDDSDADAHNSYSSSGGDDSRSSSDADDGAGGGGGGPTRHQRDRRGGGGAGGSSVPLAEFASDAHDDPDAPSLPSAHFTSQLSSHIKLLAEESARNAQSPFARLYKSAQQTKIKKKIKAILVRPDLKKEKKVEMIAALLTPLEDAGGAAPAAGATQGNSPMAAASSSSAAAAASAASHGHQQMQGASPIASA